ncbi:hypothetical protein [Pedobacter sp. GR22-10]|nr:hypothetical protein [Pedobacter sp. GR22-10]MCX2429146.1 hypothetical protein [Pedobacter sp. GR22-10]
MNSLTYGNKEALKKDKEYAILTAAKAGGNVAGKARKDLAQ